MEEEMHTDVSATECSICCEEMDMSNEHSIYRTMCNHQYHTTCMIKYAVTKFSKMQNLTCPLCRSIECNKHDANYYDIRQEMVALGLIEYTSLNIVSRPQVRETNTQEIVEIAYDDDVDFCFCKKERLIMYIFITLLCSFFAYIITGFVISLKRN
jgi:hypothetical protein